MARVDLEKEREIYLETIHLTLKEVAVQRGLKPDLLRDRECRLRKKYPDLQNRPYYRKYSPVKIPIPVLDKVTIEYRKLLNLEKTHEAVIKALYAHPDLQTLEAYRAIAYLSLDENLEKWYA